METIQGFISFLLLLVPVGTTVRIVLCLIYATAEEDPAPYRKKARNALIYAVLAESIAGILKLAAGYFGGGVIF